MRNQTANVPNQPRTPQRSVRVPDNVWFPAHEAAKRRDENLSHIMRDSLEAFVMMTDEQWEALRDVVGALGISRPELFSTAIIEFVERHRGQA